MKWKWSVCSSTAAYMRTGTFTRPKLIEPVQIARGTSASRELGIVFLTACTGERDVARGIGAGADAYVKKPFAWQDLIEPIERMLERRRGTPAPASPSAA